MAEPVKLGALGKFRALTSALLGRANLANMAGFSFGGKRDMYKALGYQRILYPRDFSARYRRNGLANRIVESYPRACWRDECIVLEDEKSEEPTTKFEKEWDALNTRLRIQSMFQRLDILAGVGRYGIMLIGAPGELSDPLEDLKADDILYLMPYMEEDAPILTYETNPEEERFGQPLMYALRQLPLAAMISPNPDIVSGMIGTGSPLTSGKPVHWTRVIHVAENLLDNQVFGAPRLEKVWNLLDDIDKVVGGGAEAFWKRADAGMQLDLAPEIELGESEQENLDKEIEEYTHNLERVLTTRGVTVKQLGSNVADFKGPSGAIIDMISAATGIPQRILMGSEMGHLASTQDKTNWDQRVQDRRTDFCYWSIVRPFVDRLIELGALTEPSEYQAKWPEIELLTDMDKADGATKWAGLNRTFGSTVVTSEEIRAKWFDMKPVEETDTESYKAEGANKMATVNKTMGLTIFTPKEMRETWYGWPALSPEEEVPVGAPEKISVDQAPTEPGQTPKPAPVVPGKGKTLPPGTPVALPPKPPQDHMFISPSTHPAKPGSSAVQKALEQAVEQGRRVLNTPELRAAMSSGDRVRLEHLLNQSVDAVERELRA